MGSWKYWRFVRLDAAGNRKVAEVAAAKAFLDQQFDLTESSLTDATIQRHLLSLLRDETAPLAIRQAAEGCLRCFVSSQIEQVCIELAEQFGKNGRFTRTDLFPLVLNDVDIAQPLLATSDVAPYRPLVYKILQTFDPQQSTLSTWTRRLVERDKALNEFLQAQGIYRISDWALLNHETPRGIQRKLSHLLTPAELQQAAHLLKAYHTVYKADRLSQNQTGQKCLPPTAEQLQRITDRLQSNAIQLTPQQVFRELRILAHHLRQVQSQASDPLDEQRLDQQPASDPDQETQDILLTAYLQEFSSCVDLAIKQVFEARFVHYSKKPPKHQNFLLGMYLFHCECRSMGEFASEVGLQQQFQVARLLKLKEFWQDVRRQTIELMLNHERLHQQIADYINSTRLASLDQQLEAVLDRIVAEVRAESTSPNRTGSSFLSTRLCNYLNYRRQQS